MIRRPPRSTQSRSSAASDVYKRQDVGHSGAAPGLLMQALRVVREAHPHGGDAHRRAVAQRALAPEHEPGRDANRDASAPQLEDAERAAPVATPRVVTIQEAPS